MAQPPFALKLALSGALIAHLNGCNSNDAPPPPPAGASAEDDGGPPIERVSTTPPADAQKSDSGLAWKVIETTTSTVHPRAHDFVQIRSQGWTKAGEPIATAEVPPPVTIDLTKVQVGWREAITKLKVNERDRFWIPAAIQGFAWQRPQEGPTEVVDIQLLGVRPGPLPLPAPPDAKEPPAKAKQTKSGIKYVVLKPGRDNKRAAEGDGVRVLYTGWTADGVMFESTTRKGAPAQFTLKPMRIMPGLLEALELINTGERARFWIPEALASRGVKELPLGTLVFDIEMVEIVQAPKPDPAPPDVAAVPKNAKKTASGLAYRVLKPGTGHTHPTPDATVRVAYTGWTKDGKAFDGSYLRGGTLTIALGQAIRGWVEALPLMVEGEKTRFWIPPELAYKNNPDGPQGTLVFDIELQKINPEPAPAPAAPEH